MQTRAQECEHTGMYSHEYVHRPSHSSTHRAGPPAPSPSFLPPWAWMRPTLLSEDRPLPVDAWAGGLSARRAGSVPCSLTWRRGCPVRMLSASRVRRICLLSRETRVVELTFHAGPPSLLAAPQGGRKTRPPLATPPPSAATLSCLKTNEFLPSSLFSFFKEIEIQQFMHTP